MRRLQPDPRGVVPLTRARRAVAVAAALVLAGTGAVAAADPAGTVPGSRDATFGDQGSIALSTNGFSPSTGQLAALATGPDGSAYALDDGRVRRFLGGGEDTSYGARVTLGALDTVADLTVDAQGRVLVLGSVTTSQAGAPVTNPAVVRLTSDGGLDGGYGIRGVAIIPVGAQNVGTSLVVDGTGNAVVAGTIIRGGGERPFLARLLPSGAPDTSFAGTGLREFPSPAAGAFRVRTDGEKILFGGASTAKIVVARTTADGTLDPSFGTDGVATAGDAMPDTSGLGFDFVVLPDHRVRMVSATGTGPTPSDLTGQLSGLTSDGAPDVAVGPQGRRTIAPVPSGGTVLSRIAADGDGLYVGGATGIQQPSPASVTGYSFVGHLSLDGAPLGSFSDDGWSIADTDAYEIPLGLGVDARRRPVIVAIAQSLADGRATYRSRVARFVSEASVAADAADAQAAAAAAQAAAAAAAQPPAPAPAAPTAPQSAPATTPPPRPKVIAASTVIKLPAATRCVSRRSVKLTVRVPVGKRLKTLRVRVGTGKARPVKSGASISLKGRAGRKVKVTVTATMRDGTRYARTVTYRLCAAKKATRKAAERG